MTLTNTLSRNEMKNIMAGNEASDCNPPCSESAISCCCGGGKVTCVSTINECTDYCGVTPH